MALFNINLSKDLYNYNTFLQSSGLSDNTIRAYMTDLNDFILFCKKNNSFDKSLSNQEFKILCEKYVKYTQEYTVDKLACKKRRCSSIRKLNKYLYIIKNQRNNYYPNEIPTIAVDRKLYHSVLSKSDIEKLKNYFNNEINNSSSETQLLKNSRNRLMFLIILNTGIKAYEVINLKWNDVCFNRKVLKIKNGKNNPNRELVLNAEMILELDCFKRMIVDMFGEEYGEFIDDCYIFFGANPETKLTTKTVRCITQTITKKSIIDIPLSPILIRHTMAYFALKDGMPLDELSKVLGHKYVTSTNELYETLLEQVNYSHL